MFPTTPFCDPQNLTCPSLCLGENANEQIKAARFDLSHPKNEPSEEAKDLIRCGVVQFRLSEGGTRIWCVCVPLVITGIQSDCAFFFFLCFKQGDMACVQGPCPTKLPDARDMRADHSHVPAIFQFSERREASFPFKTSRIQWLVRVLLEIGTLGRRVAPLSVQYTLS